MATDLYPVEHIRRTRAAVYVQILEFCTRATFWYLAVTNNPLKKAWRAASKPWKLEFQEIQTNIEELIRQLRDQSTLAHQAETRHLHSKLSMMDSKLTEIHSLFAGREPYIRSSFWQAPQGSIPADPSIRDTLPFIAERVNVYLSANRFDPERALKEGVVSRDKRRIRGAYPAQSAWSSAKLKDWISSPSSAMIRMRGSLILSDNSKSFAIDMIQLMQSVDYPVIWFLSSLAGRDAALSHTDIFRSLIQQVLERQPGCFTGSHLNDKNFEQCKTTGQWISLFVAVLGHLPRIVVVIDTNDRIPQMSLLVDEFLSELENQDVSTVVKVLILTYGAPEPRVSSPSTTSGLQASEVSLNENRRPGTARATLSPAAKLRSRPHARRSDGPEILRPFLMRSMEPPSKATTVERERRAWG